ncbi:MAG: glycerate kinase [Bacteroidota bacterium]|nr:glycerate kinase [Bacteroidota bacterium]
MNYQPHHNDGSEMFNRNTRILVAPNSYKECASSTVASELIAQKLVQIGYLDVTKFPLSDGGDGFLEVCRRNFHFHLQFIENRKCYNNSRTKVCVGYDAVSKTAYVEVADFIGLKKIPKAKRKPTLLNSRNLGEFILHLQERNPEIKKIIIGIGGTGINDLGLGLCDVFGLQLFDKNGKSLDAIPLNYFCAAKIVLPRKIGIAVEVVLDVEIPLYGDTGTSKIFAAQKGADYNDITMLEVGVINILSILERDHGFEFKMKLIGAGGGVSLGLSLISDVRITRSQQFLMDTLKLGKLLDDCDVVITGEGKFDEQSFMNKATGIVIKEAQARNKKIIMLVGSSEIQFPVCDNNVPKVFEFIPLFKSSAEAMENFEKGISLGIEQCFGTADLQANRISKSMLLM